MSFGFFEWARLPLTSLPGVGPARANKFAVGLRVSCLGDLLRLMPIRHEEAPEVATRKNFFEGSKVIIDGTVVRTALYRPRQRLVVVKAYMDTDFGEIEALWFGQPWMYKNLKSCQKIVLSGRLSLMRGAPKLLSPRVMSDDSLREKMPLRPIYSEVKGLSSRQISGYIQQALADAPPIEDSLSDELLDLVGVPHLDVAFKFLHSPTEIYQVDLARRRLAWGEVLQREIHRLRSRDTSCGTLRKTDDHLWAEIAKLLPFSLNLEQLEVLNLLRQDFDNGIRIQRLLHGEVGSGKTAVAFCLAMAVVAQGGQVALLAPTEILARQHLNNFMQWIGGAGARVVGFFGDDAGIFRRKSLSVLSKDVPLIAIGTHALFGKEVVFRDLQLVVFDEQHRFGVRQKSSLIAKGSSPNVLTMTATPIPRTLAWSQYGALNPCVLRSRINSDSSIRTIVHDSNDWLKVVESLLDRATKGERIFIVVPRVEGIDGLWFWQERLLEQGFPRAEMKAIHGRMLSSDIHESVTEFRDKVISILLGTSVVEVGLDIPDIPLMLVVNAHRFGLASLHQLRGRLSRGRGASSGECHLLTSTENVSRLKPLETCTDGFAVAQMDLKLRGPGDLQGVRQHGKSGFQIFNPSLDADLVEALRSIEVQDWIQGRLFSLAD